MLWFVVKLNCILVNFRLSFRSQSAQKATLIELCSFTFMDMLLVPSLDSYLKCTWGYGKTKASLNGNNNPCSWICLGSLLEAYNLFQRNVDKNTNRWNCLSSKEEKLCVQNLVVTFLLFIHLKTIIEGSKRSAILNGYPQYRKCQQELSVHHYISPKMKQTGQSAAVLTSSSTSGIIQLNIKYQWLEMDYAYINTEQYNSACVQTTHFHYSLNT